MPVDDLMRIPRRVGIAGGPRKLDAIQGALAGGWVTTLITDLRTAEDLTA
ncbi:MAG: sugar-binding domain-containing protein [Microbacterium sp.]